MVLSDVPGTRAEVLGKISDHNMVLASVPLSVPKETALEREVWCYNEMDYEQASDLLQQQSWPEYEAVGADAGSQQFTDAPLHIMSEAIPRKQIKEKRARILGPTIVY